MTENDSEADDCVHSHPVPPDQIAKYSPVRDADAEQDIARYVEIEAQGEEILHVEKIKEEVVLGEKYELWDVVTDKGRWWVITNLTNLYSQEHFPSLDYTLSFHIGLMARLRSRDSDYSLDPEPFDEIQRRRDQAMNRYEEAVEAEDYQAVGLSLRECLLRLISVIRDHVDVGEIEWAPKGGDFCGWLEVVVNRLCPGGTNKQLRQYMKTVGRETWQLVNWLTHDRNANSTAASISLHSFDTLFGHLVQLLVRDRTDNINACPRCASRDIRSHYDPLIEPSGNYYSSCGSCGWTSHPEGQDR